MGHSALDNAVEGISADAAVWIDEARTGHEVAGIKVIGLILCVTAGAKQADAQAKIQRQAIGYAPVVLEVWLKNLVPQVILRLIASLGKSADPSGKQVRKRVARGYCRTGIKCDEPVDGRLKLRQFVLLGGNERAAELEVVTPDDLGDVIAEGIDGIGIQGTIGHVAGILCNPVENAAIQLDSGQFPSAKPILEEPDVVSRRALPRAQILEGDVVHGVTEDKLIKQSG